MEETKILYQIFSRFTVALGVLNGLTLIEARKLISKQFKKHPFEQEAKALIKKIDKDEHERIEELFDKIILVCEELGPRREYVTLVNILENIGKSNKKYEIPTINTKTVKSENFPYKIIECNEKYYKKYDNKIQEICLDN